MEHEATQLHTTLHLHTRARQQQFLTAYTDLHTVKAAAAAAGIHRSSVYRWRSDPAFCQAMRDAEQIGYQHWRESVLEPLLIVAKRGKAAVRAHLRQRHDATQSGEYDT